MNKSSVRALCATVLATGVMAGGMTGAGAAFAEDAGGLILPGVNNGDCTATIKVTNFTNSTFFQPDWWFEQENDPAMVNATTIPAEMPAPWHESSGIQWPMARWVGDPPLASGLGPGVDGWGNGNLYSRNAQPDGFVTQRTIDLKTVTGAPEPSAEGTKTIWFRIKTGPQTADQLPAPQKLVVEGCRSSSGGLDFGSLSL